MHIHVSLNSNNSKTGKMVVTTSPSYQCPPECPFNDENGCLAKNGKLGLHWGKVSTGERGRGWNSFLHILQDMQDDAPWRHNQGGDLAGWGSEIDIKALAELVDAQSGKRGFTYTHKPVLSGEFAASNREAIRRANAGGFTINLSGNSLSEVDALADLGIGPVVAVVKRGTPVTQYTAKGRKGIVCPAQRTKGLTCKDCMLCQRRDRSVAVLFYAHGGRAKKVEAVCDARN